jgi:hypothetical protein
VPPKRFALPWGATAGVLPPGGLRVRLAAPRAVVRAGEGGSVEVLANRRRWRFGAAARPLLEALAAGGEAGLGELARAGGLSEAAARALVKELVAQGLAVATEEGDGERASQGL